MHARVSVVGLVGIGGLVGLAALLGAGCGLIPSIPGLGGNDAGPSGATTGQMCGSGAACRSGLSCEGGTCQPSHAATSGTPCTISAECATGLYCGPARTCVAGGSGAAGDACMGDGDCGPGLRCNVVGFATACQPEGHADVGGACKTSGDCFGGLACADGLCAPLPPNPNGPPPLGLPSSKQLECSDPAGPVKAFFRVPRGSGDGDFYRLPFPNDIRKKGGHPDLTGHPTAGAGLVGFDAVDRYLRDVEQNTTGFSPNPSVVFRFSGPTDFESLKGQGVVRFVDVTPGQKSYELGYGWRARSFGNHYVCANNLIVRAGFGTVLLPGHTYAVVIKAVVKDSGGTLIARDDDFVALLGAQAPADAALTSAFAAYKPLRDYLAASMTDPATVLTAAVFTVGDPGALARKLPAAVAAAPLPTASNWVRCGDGPSPCPQATGDRACGAADPAFDELHALVSLPIFQNGTAPYLDPADGGDIHVGNDGTPSPVRSEPVCMALTIPKGVAMPPGGWPLVIYAHGTGGSFRSGVDVAGRMAAFVGASGKPIPTAVLGIDQVEHGPRRGTSTQSPNTLFYNFANPNAARGNPMQGAADQLSLLRFARGLTLAGGASPTKAEIRFGRVAFWGHSQGATEVSIAIPYVDNVAGVVLSGQGASLVDSLTTKTSPVNIAAAVPFVLGEVSVGNDHPVLAVLQTAIDPVDPLNHALAMAAAPLAPGLAKQVFQPFAQGDTYSPVRTQLAYLFAAGFSAVKAPANVTMPDADLVDLKPLAPPAGGNLRDGARAITALVREYAPPPGTDGHFVSFRDTDGKRDVDHFLADVLESTDAPKIGR